MECNVDAGSGSRQRSCDPNMGAGRRSAGLPAGQVGESRPLMLAVPSSKKMNSNSFSCRICHKSKGSVSFLQDPAQSPSVESESDAARKPRENFVFWWAYVCWPT
jgi:hypothetical protein